MSRQDRGERADLAERLAAIKTILETRQVSDISNPLFTQKFKITVITCTRYHSKLRYLDLMELIL